MRNNYRLVCGMELRVKVIRPERLFGTRTVWPGRVPVQVSDPARTIIDILDDPELGGGIRQVADMLEAFVTSDHRDDGLLIEYGDRLGNRTVFKRLGHLLEARYVPAPVLVAAARDRVSAGITTLDPSAPRRTAAAAAVVVFGSRGRRMDRDHEVTSCHRRPSSSGLLHP
ncbi:MAG: hypothetical protein H0V12_03050 [Chloroflexi bacterium]|nr:hypothetical protein [Chloroflexota bacterium]